MTPPSALQSPRPNALPHAFEGLNRWSTWRELCAQPSIWSDWADTLEERLPALRQWVAEGQYDEIWFCGAGTSAFAADIIQAALPARGSRPRWRAVPTTDLVARPHDFLPTPARLLVVQFGRSGDSPESVGTLDALDALAPEADRLHITCHAAGALARRRGPGPGRQQVVVLPEATHDAGFAMTSSFSTMLLTALAVFDTAVTAPAPLLRTLARSAQGILDTLTGPAAPAWLARPERCVFLGNGPLLGAAREAALKVLELNAGQIPTQWDSALGFRHGPKAFVLPATRIFVFCSAEPSPQPYEADLVRELHRLYGRDAVVTLGAPGTACDFSLAAAGCGDGWRAVLPVLVAQVASVLWANTSGLHVDNPFQGGQLTRVVQGVTLYPVAPAA